MSREVVTRNDTPYHLYQKWIVVQRIQVKETLQFNSVNLSMSIEFFRLFHILNYSELTLKFRVADTAGRDFGRSRTSGLLRMTRGSLLAKKIGWMET